MRIINIVIKIYITASALNYNITFKINNRSIYSNFKNSIIKLNIVSVKFAMLHVCEVKTIHVCSALLRNFLTHNSYLKNIVIYPISIINKW